MNFIKNKNILFIGTGFNNYDSYIKEEMIRKGANVSYINMSLYKFNINIVEKVLNKLTLNFLYRIHYLRELDIEIESEMKSKKKSNYDFVFVIKGEFFKKKIIKNLKDYFSDAKFILYQYDSIDSIKNFNKIKAYFDFIFSYDTQDCINNENMIFRPTFFGERVKSDIESKLEYDIYFIGAYSKYRFDIIEKILYSNIDKKCFIKLKSRNNLEYMFNYLISSNKKTYRDIVISKPISYAENVDYILKSKAVLEIVNINQKASTIRTTEIMGMEKKLITDYKKIYEYDFYNENNICIINEHNLNIEQDFLNSKYIRIADDIKYKYSVEGFVEDIFRYVETGGISSFIK